MYKKGMLIALIVFSIILVGCSGPSKEATLGNVLLSESFDSSSAWETYFGETVELEVVDGSYRVRTGDEGYIWGLNEASHSDVVIEVEASQLSEFENNAYGVMCRADTSNNGDGYYFLVSGDGYYSIGKGEGPDVTPLVDWETSSAVNEGQATNSVRAVCVGDYLALFVNDRFVAEATDSTYSSGYTGLTATAFDGGDTDISFDNLSIWEATVSE